MKKIIITGILLLFAVAGFSQTRPSYLQIADVPYVDVKSFGAKGDGVTDDRAAIQAAIDFCVTNKKTLLISKPAAYYLIKSTHPTVTTASLYVGVNDFSMIGHADKHDEQVSDIFGDYAPGEAPDAMLRIVGKSTTLRNISFRSKYTAATVKFPGPTALLIIDNCSFEGGYMYDSDIPNFGLWIGGTIRSIISSCNFRGNGTGLYLGPTSTSVSLINNYARGNKNYGYYIRGALYSSLVSNACDSTGILANVEYTGNGTAYHFLNCDGIKMVSCGAEVAKTAILIGNSSLNIENFVAVSVGTASGSHVISMAAGQPATKTVVLDNFVELDPRNSAELIGGSPRGFNIQNTNLLRSHIKFDDPRNTGIRLDTDTYKGILSLPASGTATILDIPFYSSKDRWATHRVMLKGAEIDGVSARQPRSFSAELVFNEVYGEIPFLSSTTSGVASIATGTNLISITFSNIFEKPLVIDATFTSGNASFGLDYASSSFQLR